MKNAYFGRNYVIVCRLQRWLRLMAAIVSSFNLNERSPEWIFRGSLIWWMFSNSLATYLLIARWTDGVNCIDRVPGSGFAYTTVIVYICSDN